MNLPYSDRLPSDLQVVLELTVDIQRQGPFYAVHMRVVALCLSSGDSAQQLAFEDELALFVLLASLIRLVVFPADGLVTLFAGDVSDNMSSGCHVSLHSLSLLDIYNVREEEGFAMLATEVARYNVIEVCQVRLALLATEDLLCIEIRVVREAHLPRSSLMQWTRLYQRRRLSHNDRIYEEIRL